MHKAARLLGSMESSNPCCWRGKRLHHHGGGVCWLFVLLWIDSWFQELIVCKKWYKNNLKMRLTRYFLIHVGVHHTWCNNQPGRMRGKWEAAGRGCTSRGSSVARTTWQEAMLQPVRANERAAGRWVWHHRNHDYGDYNSAMRGWSQCNNKISMTRDTPPTQRGRQSQCRDNGNSTSVKTATMPVQWWQRESAWWAQKPILCVICHLWFLAGVAYEKVCCSRQEIMNLPKIWIKCQGCRKKCIVDSVIQ